MRTTRSIALAICLIALLAGACGGDDDAAEETGAEADQAAEVESSDEPEETTSTAVETSTTTETANDEDITSEDGTGEDSSGEDPTSSETEEADGAESETGIPGSTVAVFLSQAYLFGSEQGPASADQLPFPANTVTAHWYQSDGFYVVVYGGLAPEQALCPGNSIQTSSGFEFVSNAPLGGADCSFAPVVAEAPNGVVTCNRVVSYVTLIPAGTEGNLFGTIETMSDGLGVGLTSQVAADPANMPELDRSLIDC